MCVRQAQIAHAPPRATIWSILSHVYLVKIGTEPSIKKTMNCWLTRPPCLFSQLAKGRSAIFIARPRLWPLTKGCRETQTKRHFGHLCRILQWILPNLWTDLHFATEQPHFACGKISHFGPKGSKGIKSKNQVIFHWTAAVMTLKLVCGTGRVVRRKIYRRVIGRYAGLARTALQQPSNWAFLLKISHI